MKVYFKILDANYVELLTLIPGRKYVCRLENLNFVTELCS
jgi:hypothetical protein